MRRPGGKQKAQLCKPAHGLSQVEALRRLFLQKKEQVNQSWKAMAP
jgi:hypothetical protein